MKEQQLVRPILAASILLILAQGCATDSVDDRRVARYRPDADRRTPWLWTQVSEEGGADRGAESAAMAEKESEGESARFVRQLRRGGKVSIHLRGIPSPEEVIEVVDDLGGVSLPLIGFIKLAGLTTSEAEGKIAAAYVKSGYYTSITIIVVAEDEEYFVRGEVKREGRYPIAGDLTLLQAIASAGGYTDYAKLSKISVMREGQEPKVYSASKIEKRRAPDPLIEPGDIIVVPRRWLW